MERVLTADVSNSTTTAVDVAGLALRVGPGGIVPFRFDLIVDAAAVTTGIQLGLNGPASPASFSARIEVPSAMGTSPLTHVTAYESYLNNNASAGTTRVLAQITGVIIGGPTAGDLVPRLKSEIATSAVSVRRGSRVEYEIH